MADTDVASIWEYDNGPPEQFSLTRLREAAEAYFAAPCKLIKIAEGGYHKVYDILQTGGGVNPDKSLHAVARVASSAFPGDKMKSEIATLRYIASHSSVPVPSVLAWNVDASNPVGAEYMIMQKIPGVPAFEHWEKLPIEIKERVVTQVAEHLAALFSLRFEKAGSLYCSPFPSEVLSASASSTPNSDTVYEIGPVVSGPFFSSMDGTIDYANTDLHHPSSSSSAHLQSLRGPFDTSGDYLAHYLRATLFKCTEFPNETMDQMEEDQDGEDGEEDKTSLESHREKKLETLQRAQRVLQKAIELCGKYPGDAPVYPDPSTPEKPFTFRMEDFRLVNIMIDTETGKVNGFIDFEAITTAPLWLAATVPQWIPDPDGEMASWYGGTPEDQRRVWDAFHLTMNKLEPEWRKANEHGELFRLWDGFLELGVEGWASDTVEQWVDERLAWASEEGNRGVPMPENETE